MKKFAILLSSLSIAIITSSAFADVCPSSDSFTITKKPDGTFAVSVPSGYSYLGAHWPISKTGPISYNMTLIMSAAAPGPSGPYSNVIANNDVQCWYGVGKTDPGTFPGGIFIVTEDGTTNYSFNLGENWSSLHGDPYQCTSLTTGQSADCSFSLTSKTKKAPE